MDKEVLDIVIQEQAPLVAQEILVRGWWLGLVGVFCFLGVFVVCCLATRYCWRKMDRDDSWFLGVAALRS